MTENLRNLIELRLLVLRPHRPAEVALDSREGRLRVRALVIPIEEVVSVSVEIVPEALPRLAFPSGRGVELERGDQRQLLLPAVLPQPGMLPLGVTMMLPGASLEHAGRM